MEFPAPQVIDVNSVSQLKWGIFGTGWISNQFVSCVQAFTPQNIHGVAASSMEKAETFAAAHNIPVAVGSYQELALNSDIDAIYIGTRSVDHLKHALLAIEAGKHVLIEKPIALNSAEANEILRAGTDAGVLVMEAMWTKYLPQASVVRQLISENHIGVPELILADFCQNQLSTADENRWTPDHGTIMFDMGIYPVSFCMEYLGFPNSIEAFATLNDAGIEEEVSARLGFPNGSRAIFTVSGKNDLPHHASISGKQGIIELETPFFVPSGVKFIPAGFNQRDDVWLDAYPAREHDGIHYEATAFASYVDQGFTESPLHDHSATLKTIEVIEEILRKAGVSYIK